MDAPETFVKRTVKLVEELVREVKSFVLIQAKAEIKGYKSTKYGLLCIKKETEDWNVIEELLRKIGDENKAEEILNELGVSWADITFVFVYWPPVGIYKDMGKYLARLDEIEVKCTYRIVKK